MFFPSRPFGEASYSREEAGDEVSQLFCLGASGILQISRSNRELLSLFTPLHLQL
jgi:hypothetical protein